MVKKLEEGFISPGTAGLSQRIPSLKESYINSLRKYELSAVQYNKVMSCGQNQY